MAKTQLNWLGTRLASGRYQVTAHLGEGGMGQVYRAKDRKLDADVVIKVPRPSLLEDPEFVTRFTREVRALVRLEHPHIVKVIDVDVHEGVPFAVMAYLAGGSLEDRLPTDPEGRRVAGAIGQLGEWLKDVSQALDFVHKQGFVHRDVKPANILFDAQGHVFLSDFGVAKAVAELAKETQSSLTGTGVVLGTPAYLAPEMALGKEFDGRADQYALAVTVYELLSGRVPFSGPTPAAVLLKQTSELPPRLEALNPNVPKLVADAIHKAMAKNPNLRFTTCAAFAKTVNAAMPAGIADSVDLKRRDALRLSCPACGRSCRLPLEARGKRVRCPACKESFVAPDTSPDQLPKQADTAPNAQWELDTAKNPAAGVVAAPPRQWSVPLLPLLLGGASALAVLVLLIIGHAWYSGPREARGEKGQGASTAPSKTPTITLDATAITLDAGEKESIEVAIERNGYDGPIELTVDDLPARVSESIPRILPGSSRTRLELKAATDARSATRTIKVTARLGSVSVSDVCKLTVVEAERHSDPQPPDFPPHRNPPTVPPAEPAKRITLARIPDIELELGTSKQLKVQVERQGYQGPIDVTLGPDQHRLIRVAAARIPAGQTEVELTAEAEAAPKDGTDRSTSLAVRAVALDAPELTSVQDVTVRLKEASKPAAPVAAKPYVPPTPPRPREVNHINMRLVWINPGTFMMGSPPNEERRDPRDEHLHEVTISRGFYLGAFEVTQEQYQQIMGKNPSLYVDRNIPKAGAKPGEFTTPAGGSFGEAGPPRLPVERVSWDDAVAFCEALSRLPAEQFAGRKYRLPTEAEWEYACRAGTRTAFSWGPSAFDIRTYAWGQDNSGRLTHPVGLKKPNAWGLYDMHGNVAEWCQDWYEAEYYKNSPAEDPPGPATGERKVVRGGAFQSDEMNRPPSQLLRSAMRFDVYPVVKSEGIGFRVACDLVEPVPLEKLGGVPGGPIQLKPQ